MELPVSLTCNPRFNFEISISPIKPTKANKLPNANASSNEIGISAGRSRTHKIELIKIPPHKPATVLFGLKFGAIDVFPNIEPEIYCPISFTEVTKNSTSNK